jgi:hypothetical protein
VLKSGFQIVHRPTVSRRYSRIGTIPDVEGGIGRASISRPQLAGPPTSEEVRAHNWGPWHFSADGRDDTNRTVAPQQLAIGEWTRYGPTPTSSPPWSTTNTDAWHRDYANEPVRLSA